LELVTLGVRESLYDLGGAVMRIDVCWIVARRIQTASRRACLALATFAIAWTFLVTGPGWAQVPTDTGQANGTWVMVKYLDANQPVMINGFVEKSDYEKLLSGEAKGFIKLDHVFWVRTDGFYYQEQEKARSGQVRYVQLRAAIIYELRPLKDEFVKKAFSKEERDRASQRQKAAGAQGIGTQGIH